MKRILPLMLAACLFLSGCSIFSDSYVSVTPHRESSGGTENKMLAASDYSQLRSAMIELVHSGTEHGIIYVSDYETPLLQRGLADVSHYVQNEDAIGAYTVESIEFEQGTNGIVPAVAVTISYRHDKAELQKIQTVRDSNALWTKMETALIRCEPSVVVLVETYSERDLVQLVDDYSLQNPSYVMEVPQVSWEVYPDSGNERVVELRFSYQNSRTDLRQMQSRVQDIFNSAALYASGGSDYQKLSRLYAFLMERFSEYQIKTSMTPAYSLLHHGVGDSRAFAMVYAQMCRMAGLDSRIVTGTLEGEPWFWNIVQSDDCFYHVDLLRSHSGNGFELMVDEQMQDYVWDYSAYPSCIGVPEAEMTRENPPEDAE